MRETGEILRVLEIPCERGHYPVYIGKENLEGCFKQVLDGFLHTKCALIVTDEHVKKAQSRRLEALVTLLSSKGITVEVMVLPPGEHTKSLSQLDLIWSKMTSLYMTRHDVIVTFGGGVIGDLSGFAAATYNRGTKWIQIPTTMLSQVDSSVGGKVAINRLEGKNLVGTFYSPDAVLIDIEVLKSLPKRQLVNGLVESIKCGYIKDQQLLCHIDKLSDALKDQLVSEMTDEIGDQSNFELDNQFSDGLMHQLLDIVEQSVRIKAHFVSEDEREGHIRAMLNFGHTLGHAIEAALNFEHYLHGEAVGLGMLFALEFGGCSSTTRGGCAEKLRERLERLGLPTTLAGSGIRVQDVVPYLIHDKKMSGDAVTFVFIDEAGTGVLEKVSLATVVEYIESGQADWLNGGV